MNDTFELTAYHKNDCEVAAKNVAFQRFFVSKKHNLWLGDGIYFWEKKEDAEWWNGNYEIETILSAELCCRFELFADLDDRDELNSFVSFCEQTKKYIEQAEYSVDFNNGKKVAPFFCNLYKEMYNLLLMKYSFPECSGRPQYCATDNSIISNIKIVAQKIGGEMMWC